MVGSGHSGCAFELLEERKGSQEGISKCPSIAHFRKVSSEVQ